MRKGVGMGIRVSNQALAYMRRKQIQNHSVLNLLAAGSISGKSGNTASKLCVTGRTRSSLSMNMYDATGKYSYASGFTGMFHYDVYMYQVEGKRYIGGPEGFTGGMVIRDSMLDYFSRNMGNPWKMADDYNFSDGIKTAGFTGNDRLGGVLTFQYGGSTQVLPASAVPQLHADQYPALKAKDNVLMLQSSSYYRFGSGGGSTVWAVTKNGFMGEANTNFWLYDADKSNELSGKAERLLNQLKKGNLYGITAFGENGGISYSEVKRVFAAVGIEEGRFRIGVDGDSKDYYFCSSGRVIDAQSLEKWSDWYNTHDYSADGYKEGDLVRVTNNLELPVDKDGHIHTDAEELSRYM